MAFFFNKISWYVAQFTAALSNIYLSRRFVTTCFDYFILQFYQNGTYGNGIRYLYPFKQLKWEIYYTMINFISLKNWKNEEYFHEISELKSHLSYKARLISFSLKWYFYKYFAFFLKSIIRFRNNNLSTQWEYLLENPFLQKIENSHTYQSIVKI